MPEQARLARGLAAFREGRFFEAHEDWEFVWLGASGEERRQLQGLIQMAAACVHLQRGRPGPAGRLLALALVKLEDAPGDLRGLPAAALRTRARELASELHAGTGAIDPALFFSPPDPLRTA
jgi:predicted metal-dependent hydrolase